MPWLRIDDRVRTHPKIVAVGPDAAWFWFCGICYCREHLTDGFIPQGMLASLCPGVSHSAAKRFATKLLAENLWHEAQRGYQVHDFLDWNPSRAEVEATREWERGRKELYRDPALTAAIRQRDGDQCRYCGVSVNWRDRRGPNGGQFDHVIPKGDHTLDNVVVACRKCNRKKSDRTPDEAGMPLISIQSGTSSGTEQNQVGLDASSRVGAIARGLGSGLGSGSDLGSEESARETKPRLVSSMKPWNEWQGQRLEVPQKWHADHVKMLGGSTAAHRLQTWYAELDAQLVRSQTPVRNWFKYLDACYASWVPLDTAPADDHVAREMAESEARRRSVQR